MNIRKSISVILILVAAGILLIVIISPYDNTTREEPDRETINTVLAKGVPDECIKSLPSSLLVKIASDNDIKELLYFQKEDQGKSVLGNLILKYNLYGNEQSFVLISYFKSDSFTINGEIKQLWDTENYSYSSSYLYIEGKDFLGRFKKATKNITDSRESQGIIYNIPGFTQLEGYSLARVFAYQQVNDIPEFKSVYKSFLTNKLTVQ